MRKKPVRGRRTPPLRWRRTHIGEWRQTAEMTQQEVADALMASGIELDRVSIVRIEGGKQMATIEVLEAMAGLYKTDVDSMLNYTPEQAAELSIFRKMNPKEQRRLLRMAIAAKEE